MYNLEILEKGCEELGITLNDTQKNQFIQFYEFLVEKNKVMNLTGITEFDEVLVETFPGQPLLCQSRRYEQGKNGHGHRNRCRISGGSPEDRFPGIGSLPSGFPEQKSEIPGRNLCTPWT